MRQIYLLSYTLFLLLFIPVSLTQNIPPEWIKNNDISNMNFELHQARFEPYVLMESISRNESLLNYNQYNVYL